ncbi:MAG: site-2 protease family protein [Clostridia bacterium]|nr:site-2 protease family protein [Clostridia bacterium]
MFDFSMSTIIQYVLMFPVILLALSLRGFSRGYVADKLGDPTPRSLGRLTLNPLKHIDIFGFLFMIFFHFGWTKYLPINARYFKKPRRDHALCIAAGPISNILLALIFALLLRVEMIFVDLFFQGVFDTTAAIDTGFNMLCVLNYILYMGVHLNIGLAVFGLLPIPPFDGARIAYLFLPQKITYQIVKYEQYIAIIFLLMLWFVPLVSGLIGTAINGLANGVLSIFGLSLKTAVGQKMQAMLLYLFSSLLV